MNKHSKQMTATPIVMSIADIDSCGAGGLSAHIETLSSLGCHCTPVVSTVTARDTAEYKDNADIDSGLLIEQIRAVLEDMPVNLISISAVGSISNAEAIHTILNDYDTLPVVLQLQSAEDNHLNKAISTLLFSQATLIISDSDTALDLAPGADTLSAGVQELLELGCNNFLITQDQNNHHLTHHWFSDRGSKQYQWPRHSHQHLGALDTLSAAVSAYLAHGLSLPESIQQGQQFTQQALDNARRFGMGALLPNRLHWCKR